VSDESAQPRVEPEAESPLLGGVGTKVASLFLIFFLLLKAYAVSRYSLTTTGALITSAPLTVLLGTIASYLYLVLPILAITLIAWLWRNSRTEQPVSPIYRAGALLVALIAFLLSPIPNRHWVTFVSPSYLLIILLLLFSIWALSRWPRVQHYESLHRPLRFIARIPPLWYVAIFIALILVPSLGRPWVPAEVLVLRNTGTIGDAHLTDGRLLMTQYPVVYVLSEGNGWLTALDAETRLLVRIPEDEVGARMVCHHSSQLPGSRPILYLLTDQDYDSPNASCSALVEDHERLLDPLVPAEPE
jgi:hypothetical protein